MNNLMSLPISFVKSIFLKPFETTVVINVWVKKENRTVCGLPKTFKSHNKGLENS